MWSIEFGANDAAASVTAATYQANLTAILNRFVGGDKLLIKTNKATSGSYNVPTSNLTAIDAVATAKRLPTSLDLNGGITLANPADYFDSIHLSQSGYAKKAAQGRIVLKSYI